MSSLSKCRQGFLLGLLVLFSISLFSQDLAISELPFQDKETVVYKVYYNWKFVWVPAGEVTFFVEEKDNHFELNVHGTSYPSYDSFFKVRDFYISRADKNNLLPLNFRRDILEGNYKRYDSLYFNQVDYQVYEKFGKSKEKAKDFNFQLDNIVLDMVSAIYYLRALPVETYEDDFRIPLRIFFDKEHFKVAINKKCSGKKKKIKSLGSLKASHYQAELVSGYIFNEGDLMDIWVSDDKNKVPVLIESPVSFGSVKAVIKSVNNLKYPSELNELIK